jgi:hypothetical protein
MPKGKQTKRYPRRPGHSGSLASSSVPEIAGCGRDLEGGPCFIKHWQEGGRRRETCVPWQEVGATFAALERQNRKATMGYPRGPLGRCTWSSSAVQPNCRCSLGLLHGPYVYKHWRENGRQKKECVPMKRLSEVALEMERQRAEAARPAEMRCTLKELRHA